MSDQQSFWERFTAIDRKFPWSFLGFTFGVLFFVAGLYLTIFYSRSASFTFEVLSENPVYDIKENVTKLEVLFDGENIRQKQQELSLLTIRVVNDGNADLPKAAFDEQALPAFAIPDAKIISVDQIHASNEYLGKFAKVALTDANRGIIQPVMMDAGDAFSFKLLVLHSEGKKPELEISGKIGGVKKLRLVNASMTEPQTFVEKVITGDILVQFARLVVYLVGGIIAFISLGVSIASISEWRTKRKRQKIVRRFKTALDVELTSRVVAVLKHYERDGGDAIARACSLLRDSGALKKAINDVNTLPKAEPVDSELIYYASRNHGSEFQFRHAFRPDAMMIRTLLDEGIVKSSEEGIQIDSTSLDFLNRFESFLLAYAPKKRRPRINADESQLLGGDSSQPSVSTDETSTNTSPTQPTKP